MAIQNRLSEEERIERKREYDKKRRIEKRDFLLAQNRAYYQNHRPEILKRQSNDRREKGKRKRYRDKVERIADGIESYTVSMAKYYTKEHRHRCYKQLKEDFQNMQRHLQVA